MDIAYSGLPENGEYREVDLIRVAGVQKGRVFLQGEGLAELPEISWLCIDRKYLENGTDLYFFQIKDCDVKDREGGPVLGHLRDYFETGAHGIFSIEMESGEEVLIPARPEIFHRDAEGKSLIVPSLADYLAAE